MAWRREINAPIVLEDAVPTNQEYIYEYPMFGCDKFYFDGVAFHEIYPDVVIPKENLKRFVAECHDLFNKGEFSRLFSISNVKILPNLITKMMEMYPFEEYQKPLFYEAFVGVYMRMDVGFELFTPRFFRQIKQFGLKSEDRIKRLETLFNFKPEFIYHGEGIPDLIKDRWSWTLNPWVAEFFANRNTGHGLITRAAISNSKNTRYVFDYFDDREESEVFVPVGSNKISTDMDFGVSKTMDRTGFLARRFDRVCDELRKKGVSLGKYQNNTTKEVSSG